MRNPYVPMTADLFEARSYYNTTALPHSEHVEAARDAGEQEERVLRYFRRVTLASPSQVWQAIYKQSHVPITSVRRAITTLAGKGLLAKTDSFVTGNYCKREHVWKLNQ